MVWRNRDKVFHFLHITKIDELLTAGEKFTDGKYSLPSTKPRLSNALLWTYTSYTKLFIPKHTIFLTFEVILLLQLHLLSFSFRRNKELTAESVKHLEKVFRENLAKDKDEFTLSEFKKIVPSKNVSYSNAGFPFSGSLNTFYSFSLWVLIDANERCSGQPFSAEMQYSGYHTLLLIFVD